MALRLFKKARRPMALVRDADSHILGVLTLEDVLEEIVGDIEDEHDAGGHGERPPGAGRPARRRRGETGLAPVTTGHPGTGRRGKSAGAPRRLAVHLPNAVERRSVRPHAARFGSLTEMKRINR